MFCLDPACSGLILVGYLVLMQTTQPTQGPDQTEHTVIPLIQHSLLNNLQMELSVMTGLSHSSVCVCVCVLGYYSAVHMNNSKKWKTVTSAPWETENETKPERSVSFWQQDARNCDRGPLRPFRAVFAVKRCDLIWQVWGPRGIFLKQAEDDDTAGGRVETLGAVAFASARNARRRDDRN